MSAVGVLIGVIAALLLLPFFLMFMDWYADYVLSMPDKFRYWRHERKKRKAGKK